MKPHCREIVEENLTEIVAALDPKTVTPDARKRTVITQEDYEHILEDLTLTSKNQKNLKFLDILKEKDGGWPFLVEHLRQQGRSQLAAKLSRLEVKSRPNKCNRFPSPELPNLNPTSECSATFFSVVQEKLRTYIHTQSDSVFNFWRDLLPNVDFSDACVDVDIITEQHLPGGKLSGLSYLWNTPGKRILLEGEPGIGKTVYAHQIALAWAQPNSELSKHFDFLFLIPLHDIQQKCENLERVLQLYLFDAESHNDVPQLLQGVDGKHDRLLFILDGFDEFNRENCEDILKLINGMRLQTATVLFTSRYVPDVLRVAKSYRRLRINGFTEQQAAAFVGKQAPANPANTEKYVSRNMEAMRNNPLLLAVWCVLGQDNATELFDLTKSIGYFDMIKLFLQHLVNRYRSKGNCISDDTLQQVQQCVGQYAWQLLSVQIPYRLIGLHGFDRNVHDNSTELKAAAAQIGFLIHKKDLSGQISARLQHQIFAEYFAATYLQTFTSSLNVTSANRSYLDQFFTSPTSYFLSGMSHQYTLNTVLKGCIEQTGRSIHVPWIVVPQLPDRNILDILYQSGLSAINRKENPVSSIVILSNAPRRFLFYNSSAVQPPYFVSGSELSLLLGGDWVVDQSSCDKTCERTAPPVVTNRICIKCLHFIRTSCTPDVDVAHLTDLDFYPTCPVCWRNSNVAEKVEFLFAKAVSLTNLIIHKFKFDFGGAFCACISAMKICKRLSLVVFKECYFGPEASHHFVKLLRDSVGRTLTSLVFLNCASLPNIALNALQYCTRLQKLYFFGITEFRSKADAIAQTFASFASTLHTLVLMDCGSAGLSTDLMQNISLLRSLKALITMSIDFTPETVERLLQSLQSLPNLLYLQMTFDAAFGRNHNLFLTCARLKSLQVANFQYSLSSIKDHFSLDACRPDECAPLHVIVSPNVVATSNQAEINELVQRLHSQHVKVHVCLHPLTWKYVEDELGINLDFFFS